MSLAVLKRKLTLGTQLKLVRHDWMKTPLVVRGNLGDTIIQPKIFVGLVRPIAMIQSNQIALRTGKELSYITWPKASSVRETENGFEIDLNDNGKFKDVMGYEIVKVDNL